MNSNLLEQTKTYCSDCRAETAEEDIFCQECGISLGRPTEPSQPSFGEKLLKNFKTLKEKVTENTVGRLPKLPAALPAVLALIFCACFLPWCVHAIDSSYDSMSEDYIAQNALKALKANNPAIAAELLLRIYMERSGKISPENVSLLAKCILARADDSAKLKDYTAALKYLHLVPKECPEYATALEVIKKLETLSAAQPGMVAPIMPPAGSAAIDPVAAQTAAAQAAATQGAAAQAAATQAAAAQAAAAMAQAQAAIAATAQPGQIKSEATAALAPPPAGKESLPGGKLIQKFISNAVGTPQTATAAATIHPEAVQTATQPAKVAQPAQPTKPAPPVEPPSPLPISLTSFLSPKPAAPLPAVQTGAAPGAVPTAQTAPANTGATVSSPQANESSLIQPGVPIWQSFSRGGKTTQKKDSAKKKVAAVTPVAAATSPAEQLQQAVQPKSDSKASGFFIDGKEISSTVPVKQEDKTGQKSHRPEKTEGQKSYNPGDVSRYNELLADYFRQHDAAPTKSGEKDSTDKASHTPDPPSFQEWVNKGKPGFR